MSIYSLYSAFNKKEFSKIDSKQIFQKLQYTSLSGEVRDLNFDKDEFNKDRVEFENLYGYSSNVKYYFYQDSEDSTYAYCIVNIGSRKYLFRVDGKKFVRKSMFSNEKKIRWGALYRLLLKTKKYSSDDMQTKNIALTTLHDYNMYGINCFQKPKHNNSLSENYSNMLIRVFEAKFSIDEIGLNKIEKVFHATKPHDVLYNDLLIKLENSADLYNLKKTEYYTAIKNLKDTINHYDRKEFERKQLEVLSS